MRRTQPIRRSPREQDLPVWPAPPPRRSIWLDVDVDVTQRNGMDRRLTVACAVKVREVASIETVARFVEADGIGPSERKLYGIGGKVFGYVDCLDMGKLAPKSIYGEPQSRIRLLPMLGEKHAVTGSKFFHVETGPALRWGSSELIGFRLGAAETRVAMLVRTAEESLRFYDGHLFMKTEMPTWTADIGTGLVRLRSGRAGDPATSPITTFSADRREDAVRLATDLGSRPPVVEGSLLQYDRSFEPSDMGRLARGLSAWVARHAADDVVWMDAGMVRTWADLHEAAMREDNFDDATACEIILEAEGFAASFLKQAEAGPSRIAFEKAMPALRWRIAELDRVPVVDPYRALRPGA